MTPPPRNVTSKSTALWLLAGVLVPIAIAYAIFLFFPVIEAASFHRFIFLPAVAISALCSVALVALLIVRGLKSSPKD
jgi:bacteriorhodopsin